jgi:hypothetical protein
MPPYIHTSSAHGQRVNHDIQVLFACRGAREELEGGGEKWAVA